MVQTPVAKQQNVNMEAEETERFFAFREQIDAHHYLVVWVRLFVRFWANKFAVIVKMNPEEDVIVFQCSPDTAHHVQLINTQQQCQLETYIHRELLHNN